MSPLPLFTIPAGVVSVAPLQWSTTATSVGWGTFSNGGLTVTAVTSNNNCAGAATRGVLAGEKKYWELIFPAFNAGNAVGFANSSAVYNNDGNHYLGGAGGGSYGNHHGLIYTNSTNVVTYETYGGSDRVCISLDRAHETAWWKVNAGNWNNNASNDPATNVGGWDVSSIADTEIFPAYNVWDSGILGACTLVATGFTYTPPSGFSAIS